MKVNLWTERGVLKHMKMLGTDKAWAGYDILNPMNIYIDSYMVCKKLTCKIALQNKCVLLT